MAGSHSLIVLYACRDELRAAWAIFTPLLHAIDNGAADVLDYKPGTRGPPAADKKIAAAGYIKNSTYDWKPPNEGDPDHAHE